MKYFVLSFLLFVCSSAYAGFFFKIAVDNSSYSSFILKSLKNTEIHTHFIIQKIRENYFDISSVDKNYYQVSIKRGVSLFHKKLLLYELTPTFSDRFKHVIWVTDDNIVVRKEVYNLNNKLMLSYGYVDELPHVESGPPAVLHKGAGCDRSLNFRGFELYGCKRIDKNTKHLIFSDGLNKFSVFIDKNVGVKKTSKKVIMGNYVYRKSQDGDTYTVVGYVPFKIMNDVITYINNKEEKHESNE